MKPPKFFWSIIDGHLYALWWFCIFKLEEVWFFLIVSSKVFLATRDCFAAIPCLTWILKRRLANGNLWFLFVFCTTFLWNNETSTKVKWAVFVDGHLIDPVSPPSRNCMQSRTSPLFKNLNYLLNILWMILQLYFIGFDHNWNITDCINWILFWWFICQCWFLNDRSKLHPELTYANENKNYQNDMINFNTFVRSEYRLSSGPWHVQNRFISKAVIGLQSPFLSSINLFWSSFGSIA